MDKDGLIQRLMATFVAELEEHARALEADLLALEKKPAAPERGEIFNTLFRTAHSLKGAARSVGVTPIEMAGHHLEEAIAAARDGRSLVDGDFFALLLPVVDGLADAARRLRAGNDLTDAPLNAVIGRLSRPQAPQARRGAAASIPEAPGLSAAAAPASPAWTGTVRVPAEKLDALLMQMGEIVAIRHRAEARGEEAAALEDTVSEWRKEWRRVEQGITLLLRRDADAATSSSEEDARRAVLRRQVEQALGRSKDGLSHLEHAVQHLAAATRDDRSVLEQTAAALAGEVHRARMLPFAEACAGLERMVRDLITGMDKQAELIIEGGEIELDRSVLEGLKDPLIHLVRNAVDHGIEPVAARRQRGKPDTGRIEVSAALRGSRVEVTVADDGKGLDLARIREQLGKQNLPVPEDARELAEAIFLPGFSTSAQVTQLSGRGIGLDIVKTRLAALRGSTEISFHPGAGTRFTLSLPLTLTSLRAVLVRVGEQIFAIETTAVERILRVGAQDIHVIDGHEVIVLADAPVPVVALADALGLPGGASLAADSGRIHTLVLQNGSRRAAFTVDSLEAERDVVVRALGPRLRAIRQVIGATYLPDGRVMFILNAADLVARSGHLTAAAVRNAAAVALRPIRKRLLVADDSATVRALQKSILEAAGYEVRLAVDGMDAWQSLSEHGADLVISDVEMPRMNGFILTETIRGSKRFHDLPVILVTAMESEADKARGMTAGADAYCVKSTFDQEAILALLEQLL